MANNYLEFSETITNLTPEERAWIEGIPEMSTFEDEIDYGGRDFTSEGEREEFVHKAFVKVLEAHGIDSNAVLIDEPLDMFPDFNCQVDPFKRQFDSSGDWWISTHNCEYGNLAHVACVVQAFIKKFRPDFVFKLTWAETCSRPRVGEFGGGWMVVSGDKMLFGNAWDEADRQAEAL